MIEMGKKYRHIESGLVGIAKTEVPDGIPHVWLVNEDDPSQRQMVLKEDELEEID
jgi:hypothetical protein